MVIMKKILIEKTKDQKKKRKSSGESNLIWKIIAVSTAVCVVLFVSVLLGMDYVMRSAAPDLYLGGRLLNTYKTLQKENEQKNDFFKGSVIPDGNTGLNVSADFEKIGFSLGGNFNSDTKKTYLGGEVDTAIGNYKTELFYDRGMSGICLPDFLDIWLCSGDNALFEDMKNSGITDKLAIPYIPSLTVPDSSKLNLQELYPLAKELTEDIKISGFERRGNGISQYDVSMNGEALKNTMTGLCDVIWSQGVFGESTGENNLLRSYVSQIIFPETAVFTVYERKKAVVYASATLQAEGEELEILIDMSKNARLSDAVEIRLIHKMDNSSYGITYICEGDHSNPEGRISDNTQVTLMLPFVDNMTFAKNVAFDAKDRFKYGISASNGDNAEISLNGTGVYTNMEFHAQADDITIKFGDIIHSGKGSIGFMADKNDFEIPDREKFELKSIPKDTLSRLLTSMGMFLGR